MNTKETIPLRFFVVTFLWSWLLWLPLVLAGFKIIPMTHDFLFAITIPISILAAFGPAAGAFVSLRTLEGKGSIRLFLKPFFNLKFGWKVWVGVFTVFGLSTAMAWYIPELFGESRLPMLLPNIYIFPIYIIMMIFFGGGQEEIGWRGYILDFLENRFGPWLGSIILALVWAFWHIPLWFIPGTSQTYVNFIGFFMLTLGYSFILSRVMKASGKRPLAALFAHGVANAFVPLFPTIIMKLGVPQPRYWIWTSLTLLIGIVIMAVGSKGDEIIDS